MEKSVDKLISAQSSVNTDKTKILILALVSWRINTSKELADLKFALDDVVINDQVGRRPERRSAVLTRDARGDAPRRKEIGVQEHAAG